MSGLSWLVILRKRDNFRRAFHVGPTTVHSFMQAMGLVNDHVRGCAAGSEVERLRREFVRPR